jgi:hypothetical protein
LTPAKRPAADACITVESRLLELEKRINTPPAA